uniref:Uncharacterized protein n=1 Tax=Vannella robusta TaxID=1487602 RepID=A0A7S4ISW5_9EUKA
MILILSLVFMSTGSCCVSFFVALDSQGDVWRCSTSKQEKESESIPRRLEIAQQIVSVSSGNFHAVFLSDTGCLWSMGENSVGQLGLGHNLRQTQPTLVENIPEMNFVSCARFQSFAIDSVGDLWAFGSNDSCKLGIMDSRAKFSPTRVEGISRLISVTAGGYASFGIDADQHIYVWGSNNYYQGGVDDSTAMLQPQRFPECNFSAPVVSIEAGFRHTLFLLEDGSVVSFGANHCGQCGREVQSDGFPINPDSPYVIQNLPRIKAISCGFNSSRCIDEEGNLWVFGNNTDNLLGCSVQNAAITDPQQIEDIQSVKSVMRGGHGTVLKDSNGELWCFGIENQCLVSETTNSLPFPCKVNDPTWNSLFYVVENRSKSARSAQ